MLWDNLSTQNCAKIILWSFVNPAPGCQSFKSATNSELMILHTRTSMVLKSFLCFWPEEWDILVYCVVHDQLASEALLTWPSHEKFEFDTKKINILKYTTLCIRKNGVFFSETQCSTQLLMKATSILIIPWLMTRTKSSLYPSCLCLCRYHQFWSLSVSWHSSMTLIYLLMTLSHSRRQQLVRDPMISLVYRRSVTSPDFLMVSSQSASSLLMTQHRCRYLSLAW